MRITLDLIRKRSEHNEGEISTLEEISLHQENIEKIELIDRTCKDLRILLLQHNLISRIENLSKLKRLEYLNLALNNIEVIENLEGLESLKKLDLTINFIGDLRGIEKLRRNENLEQLILMGNPCADYEGYREYAIATLPQIKELDMKVVERSERIRALQVYASVEGDVIRGYGDYKRRRKAEIARHRLKALQTAEDDLGDEENEEFWKQTSYHTPEDRVAIAERFLRKEEERSRKKGEEVVKFAPKLFNGDGKPYNVNQAKVQFKLDDEGDADHVILEVVIYKYLDTSYLDVDIQPNYIRVTIKGKILQLTLPCEISTERSTAKRNVINGNLVVTMPRLSPSATIRNAKSNTKNGVVVEKKCDSSTNVKRPPITRREYLEIGPPDAADFLTIVQKREGRSARETVEFEGACDNSDVPPLE